MRDIGYGAASEILRKLPDFPGDPATNVAKQKMKAPSPRHFLSVRLLRQEESKSQGDRAHQDEEEISEKKLDS